MPTYLYKREDGTTFEVLQRISEQALKTCPETGQKVKRVITGGGGVVYKGSGWYVTDYKNKKSNKSSDNAPENGNDSNGSEKSSSGEDQASTTKKASSESKNPSEKGAPETKLK